MGRPITEDERLFIVRVLKDATQNVMLLSDFERSFVFEVATSYARFGSKLQTSNARMRTLYNVAVKLCTDLTGVPEIDWEEMAEE
jgi:hypothetical protein